MCIRDRRIDLADARAAESLGDFRRDLASTARAAEKARAVGASLLLAQARADQAWALANLGRADEAAAAVNEAKRIFSKAGDRSAVSYTHLASARGCHKKWQDAPERPAIPCLSPCRKYWRRLHQRSVSRDSTGSPVNSPTCLLYTSRTDRTSRTTTPFA